MRLALAMLLFSVGCYRSHVRPTEDRDGGSIDGGRIGCDPASDPLACREMIPANVRDRVAWSAGSTAIAIASGDTALIDTDTGAITSTSGRASRPAGTGLLAGIDFEQLDPIEPGGASLGVFAMGSLDIAAGGVARAHGSRALVILAREASIDGTLSASGNASGPGPGGFGGGGPESDAQGPGAAATASDTGDALDDGGGGGGSFGSAGGIGGGVGAGAPGTVYGDADLVPILGGSGGGGGGFPGGSGGNGGGAVQLSVRGTLRMSGIVEANGSGGGGGGTGVMSETGGGGGGGGSGGAILLEAIALSIAGKLAVNGGAGGQGAPSNLRAGQPGSDGSSSEIPARAPGSDARGGPGGLGSDLSGVGGQGGFGDEGGGGGGGAGRIRLNDRAGNPSLASATSWPPVAVSTGAIEVR